MQNAVSGNSIYLLFGLSVCEARSTDFVQGLHASNCFFLDEVTLLIQ